MPEEPTTNEPINLESENIFDPDLADQSPDVTNPDWLPGVTDPVTAVVGALKELMPTRADFLKPPNLEHKVHIYVFNDSMNREEVRAEVEALLNDGYHLQFPSIICNDYVMLDFSRRKEDKEEQ